MCALLWRTCVISAAGGALALRRAPLIAARAGFASPAAEEALLRAARCRICTKPTMSNTEVADARAARAERSARLREKLAQLKAERFGSPTEPKIDEMRLDQMTAENWRRVGDALRPFMRANRITKLDWVLQRRRSNLHLVLENLADPHNAAAVLRTAEGLGVQHVHVIENVCEFHLPSANALAASKGSLGNVAMGASRWLSVHRYRSSFACYEALRELDLQILASDCPPLDAEEGEEVAEEKGLSWQTLKGRAFDAQPIEALDWRAKPAGVALVFGNERRGVSKGLVEAADASFFLPMCGFTQSFNISVAAAMALWSAIASGAFPEGTLSEEERVELMARWLLRDVKAAKPILREKSIEFVDF